MVVVPRLESLLADFRRLSGLTSLLELFVLPRVGEGALSWGCWAALLSRFLVVSTRTVDLFCFDAWIPPGLGILVLPFKEVGGFDAGG